MTAEQIVRILAAMDEPVFSPDVKLIHRCILCGQDWWQQPMENLEDSIYQLKGEPGWHLLDCPWRLAREWVAGHNANDPPPPK